MKDKRHTGLGRMLEQDRWPLFRGNAEGRKVRAPQDRVLGNAQSR